MVSFIEDNKDFVLKLKINAADGETQIRRVCLPKIADADGNLSYEELVGLVLVFTLPPDEDNSSAAAASGSSTNYTISLTYYDDDKDLITVASTDELMDAINLFAGQKFMRITTCVKPKVSYSTSSAAAAAASSSTAAGSPTVDRGTSTNVVDDGNNNDENYPPVPPIQEVRSSFVGILSNAVHHLQKVTTQVPPVAARRTSNNNNNDQKAPPQEPKENGTKAAAVATTTPSASPTKSINTKVNNGDRNNKKGLKAKRVAARKVELRARLSVAAAARAAAAASQPAIIVPGGDKEAKNKVSSFKAAAAALTTKKEVNTETAEDSTSNTKEEPEEEAEEEAKLFIHGRHTCDACLTTPIVGERYHSMNLPDYDLCKRCFVNYSGKEIKFEPVELDRDIPFQTRWQYKHQRQIMMMKRRERFGRGGGDGGPHHGPRSRRFRGPNHGRFNCRPNGSNNMLHVKPVRSPSSQENQEDVPSSTPVAVAGTDSSAEQFDNELKEAIRRSLDDVVPKDASIMERGKAKDEIAEEEDVSKFLPECSKEKENAVKSTISNVDISTYVDAPAVDVQGNRFRDAEDEIPRSVEIAKHNNMVNEDTTRDDSIMENTSNVSDEPKEVESMEKTMGKSMDTDFVDSEKLLLLEDAYKSPTPESISFINSEDVSFSSDAVGNGDIAEAMGKTLDIVAGAISRIARKRPTRVKSAKPAPAVDVQGDRFRDAEDEIPRSVEIALEERVGR
jgi:hypothetical protein